MNATDINAQIHQSASKIRDGVAAAAESLSSGADALGERTGQFQDQLRDTGRRLLDSSKDLTDEATRQARLHPLATFGIAFVAGVILARALRS